MLSLCVRLQGLLDIVNDIVADVAEQDTVAAMGLGVTLVKLASEELSKRHAG